jgi:hypothetical protein
MTWEKYRVQLGRLLDKSKEIEDEIQYLICWIKIKKICEFAESSPDVEPRYRETIRTLSEKYKTAIEPRIAKLRESIRATPMKSLLKQLNTIYFRNLDLAEENLKVVPLTSMDILEDTLFLIDLYGIAFGLSLKKAYKDLVAKKLAVLKNSFEVEGGAKDLEKKEQQITASFKAQSDGVAFPEPSPLPEINTSTIDTQTNLVLGSVSFPEESTVKLKDLQTPNISNNSSSLYSSQSETGANVCQNISSTPSNTNQTPITSTKSNAFPLSTWIPPNLCSGYLQLRYSSSSGRLIQ